MNRRRFLQSSLLAPLLLSRRGIAEPEARRWRTYEVRVSVRIEGASSRTRAWLPLPLARPAAYQRDLGHEWSGNALACRVARDPSSGAAIFCAEWNLGEPQPVLDLVMRVSTCDVEVSFDRPASPAREEDPSRYLQPTRLIPTGGIVRDTALAITRGRSSDLAKARAIYDWIVDHTHRDPAVRGCGRGDIRWMLETKSLGGKCADLNALYVGLARASGLPARDLYGIRVAPSERFPSLGRGGDVSSAQHCRAEVHLDELGWIPVDPADVRKVMLEEHPGAPLDHPRVKEARERLFGSWEMNWIAFNDAHDLPLPGSDREPLAFFMYPQAEVDGRRKDSLDPATFRYEIHSRAL